MAVFFFSTSTAWSQSAVLSWNEVTLDQDGQPEQIRGYRVYYHDDQGISYPEVWAGNTIEIEISDLINGLEYCFQVTAVDLAFNEGLPSNEACYTVPLEDCNNLADDDRDGLTDCQDQECPASSEDCDGFDNDCNGQVDDNPTGADCPLQAGVCAGSGQSCVGGVWQPCDAGSYGADYEAEETRCDGLDNDCDGQTDEALTAPPCPLQLGVCASSVRPCRGANGWGDCGPSEYGTDYEAAETLCDGLDNDCDGLVDEGCPCVPNETQPCSTDVGECQAGIRVCDQNGSWGACSGVLPTDETCDGLDNDCDGQTDEALSPPVCELQQGVCAGSSRSCGGAAGWLDCDYGSDHEATETLCDGLDNDCDGQTDEALSPPTCELVQGVCAGSVQRCGGSSGWQACDESAYGADYEAEETLCDGLDNDCDAQTDEGCQSDGGQDGGSDGVPIEGGCGCSTSQDPVAWLALVLLCSLALRRRRV